MKFTEETISQIQKIISHYPDGRQKSALLPVLHIAQAENNGWLSSDIMNEVAEILNIKPIEVYEVATFYSMYNLAPVGKCVIEVCKTGPCCLNGAEEMIAFFENKLKIKVGETTADGMFTLNAVECLAACGNAPVLKIGTRYFENVSLEMADNMIDDFRKDHFCSHKNPYAE
jgi:NADH-quinone oxidoreductase subunit E